MPFSLSILAIGLFAAAAVTDVAGRRIPNPLPVLLSILGLARIALAWDAGTDPGVPAVDLAAALTIFAAGAICFHFNLVGGGDVKLLAAGALWLGATAVWPYLMLTALAGGALALVFLARAAALRLFTGRRTTPTLPYGVAIAAGGILATTGGF